MRAIYVLLTSLSLCVLFAESTLQADVVISEFLASNASDRLDEDGDSSDWIEVHNENSFAVDLEGWCFDRRCQPTSKVVFSSIHHRGRRVSRRFRIGKESPRKRRSVSHRLRTRRRRRSISRSTTRGAARRKSSPRRIPLRGETFRTELASALSARSLRRATRRKCSFRPTTPSERSGPAALRTNRSTILRAPVGFPPHSESDTRRTAVQRFRRLSLTGPSTVRSSMSRATTSRQSFAGPPSTLPCLRPSRAGSHFVFEARTTMSAPFLMSPKESTRPLSGFAPTQPDADCSAWSTAISAAAVMTVTST